MRKSQNYKQLEKKIVDYLVKELSAEAVVFVGSRAVGDYKPNSDWDIYVLTDKKVTRKIKDKKREYGLDLEDLDIIAVLSKQKFDWNVFGLNLRFNKIMYDPKGIAKRLVSQAMKEYAKGPKVTREWVLGRKDKAQRYMKKFEDNLKYKNYDELFNRICRHFTEDIFNWWFKIRREWPLRPQDKFNYIKKREPKFYAQVRKIASDKTSYSVKVEAFRKIHKFLFESKVYKRLVKK